MTPSLFKPDRIHPLSGVEPDLPTDDLKILGDIAADAKVVALGEPTHGQKEINQLRDRMTRFLVEHMGFRIIAMEDSAIRCRMVNDFLVHGVGSAENALSAQNFWHWRTQEVLTMISWLRAWNLQHPQDMVRLIGIDIQDFTSSASELLKLLACDHLELRVMLERIGSIQMWVNDAFEEAIFSTDMANLSRIRQIITGTKTLTPAELELGLDCVSSLEQSLLLWKELAISADIPTGEQWNRRDGVMAERTISPTLKGRKVILWAHNGHVQCERMDGLPDGAMTMGQILRERLAYEYVVIAGMFGSGGYRGYDQKTGVIDVTDVGDPPLGTIDHELWSTEESTAFLINLDSPESVLFETQTTRWAGAAIEASEDMIANVRPAVGMNAIAFVRKATPSRPTRRPTKTVSLPK